MEVDRPSSYLKSAPFLRRSYPQNKILPGEPKHPPTAGGRVHVCARDLICLAIILDYPSPLLELSSHGRRVHLQSEHPPACNRIHTSNRSNLMNIPLFHKKAGLSLREEIPGKTKSIQIRFVSQFGLLIRSAQNPVNRANGKARISRRAVK